MAYSDDFEMNEVPELNEDGLYSTGDSSMSDFDDANIPVDIWLQEMQEGDDYYKDGFRYSFHCANYMPRKGAVAESSCQVYSKDKETLQKAIKKYILPLYQVAVDKINYMITNGASHLYYWSKDE